MTKLKISIASTSKPSKSTKQHSTTKSTVAREVSTGRIVMTPVKSGAISKARIMSAVITVKTASKKKKG